MISAYTPILKKSTSKSPDWYKHFHSVFYMSQLTNQILLSYLESKIEDEKEDMIEVLGGELLAKKIIRKDSETGEIIVSKAETLKSIHIEDTIDQIVKNVFENREQMMEVCLFSMGLEKEDGSKKDIDIDRDMLLKSTTSKNWFDLIKGLLNVWEFIFLYGAIESAFKEILSKQGQVREEDLLGSVFEKFDDLPDNLGFEKSEIEKIWFFYTELRNIYVHNHGFINNRIKSNLGGKLDDLKNAIYSIHKETILIADLEDILKKNLVKNSKFYFMRDTELNIFRNSMIHFIESLEVSHVDGLTNQSTQVKEIFGSV